MAICIRYLQNEVEAKDALQNCLITVFRQFDGFKRDDSLEGWLKRVAVTSSLKELRKKKRFVHALDVIENESSDLNTDPIILDQLNRDDVLEQINSLPEDYRIAFNMYIIEGYSYKEMAEILELNESTCRMKVSRARKKMQILLKTEYSNYSNARSRKVD